MKKEFRVALQKEQLIFSAAHFITFVDAKGAVICEQLHGHNYRVKCEVSGPLNDHGYVVDFIALRDKLKELVADLDHHVLLASEHPGIKVKTDSKEVEVSCQGKRWVFPLEDCALLPIANTTAELLASYLGERLVASGLLSDGVTKLLIAVDENEGQWGECQIDLA
ncbi:6-pyruvoyl tetrahydropterin synthase family protein [bacterium]|nr:6-pyruvoyl tetrahydropterin synthase family protein [bacterium]